MEEKQEKKYIIEERTAEIKTGNKEEEVTKKEESNVEKSLKIILGE